MATQGQWRWCEHCQGLHFAGNFDATGTAVLGPCLGSPTRRHSTVGSGQYTLVVDEALAPGQFGWSWCRNCQGLFYAGGGAFGHCPAQKAPHDPEGSGKYALIVGKADVRPSGQGGWLWCPLCQGLFYGESPTAGACPGRDPGHAGEGHERDRATSGSGQYTLMLDTSGSDQVAPDAEILAVHAALLPSDPDGAVVYFSGNDYGGAASSPIDQRPIDHTCVWRATTNSVTAVHPAPPRHDLFCCGQALLPDGTLLAAGGTELGRYEEGAHAHHWPGQANAAIFNPNPAPGTTEWQVTGSMRAGRWYPTLVTLPAGEVMAMGGHPDSASPALRDNPSEATHSNTRVEVWSPSTGAWRVLGFEPPAVVRAIANDRRADPFTGAAAANPNQAPYGWPEQYPRVHVLPDGSVLVVRLTGAGGDRTWLMERAGDQLRWTDLCPAPFDIVPEDGRPPLHSSGYFFLDTTVMLPLVPPDYRVRILYVGERQPQMLDLGPWGRARSASWSGAGAGVRDWPQAPANRAPRRHQCNATLLADGTVLVVGGVDTNGFGDLGPNDLHYGDIAPTHNVLEAELFDPSWGMWCTLSPLLHGRNYHTSALLLPDGRVWIAGSSPGVLPREPTIEAYRPPCLSRGPRPRSEQIALPPIGYGVNAWLPTPDAPTISRVTLVRCGSVTHGFNSDQRHIELAIGERRPDGLTITTPPTREVAPPGWYLLHLINAVGAPSRAAFCQLL